jgi:YD repeat-containing protein
MPLYRICPRALQAKLQPARFSIDDDIPDNPSSSTQPNGVVVSMTYDAKGNTLTVTKLATTPNAVTTTN